ncbi:NUDIX hydrolase [Deinococcus roseus]|uniref:Nudix hydrolase domain-containing protein n=1 Tax=Deinococcus roseus TaxID=392414 RepID=A0ABQ2D1F0_9DEIO|nr:NUDIX hydrolase [Deinococcus roseus]GGJ41334.1 hypothetical protein GCM10008938_29250 [Deinococcus roseus]
MAEALKIDESWYHRVTPVKDRTSAGGVVVRLEREKIYVAVAQEVGGQWALPKGGVERGESLLQAAIREVGEETGLMEVVSLGKLGVKERYGLKKGIWITQHFFLFFTKQLTGTPTDPRHTQGVRWFELSQFPDLFWPEQTALVRESAQTIRERVKNHLSRR